MATAVPLLPDVFLEVLVHPGFFVVCFDVVVDFVAGFLVEVDFAAEAFAVEVVEVDFAGEVDFAVVAVAVELFAVVVVELFAVGVFFGPMVSESNSF